VGFVYNEVSRRYVSDTPEIWRPEVWRSKPEGSIKQGSGDQFDDQNWADDVSTWKQPVKAKKSIRQFDPRRYRTRTGQGCVTSINVYQLLCDRVSSQRGLGSIIFVLPQMHNTRSKNLLRR
jgi:hypothetical protein